MENNDYARLYNMGLTHKNQGLSEGEIKQKLTHSNSIWGSPVDFDDLRKMVEKIMTDTNSVTEIMTVGDSSTLSTSVFGLINPESENFQERELSLTDLGNSERFVSIYKDKVRWCNALRDWYLWNGKFWQKDESLQVREMGKEVIKKIYIEASQTNDRTLQNKIGNWAKISHGESRIDAMLDLAKSSLPISPKDFDSHDYKLNLSNGVFDLKERKLYPHDQKYFFSQMIEVEYNPNSFCQNWQDFLDLVIPDSETQKFVQKSVGYSLTGSVGEQCLFFLHGKGANGKSTFIEAVSQLLGDLAQKTDADSLMGYSGSGATPYKARMRGKRFVVSSEIPDGKKWNEVLIKDLTGGDTLVARDVYQTPFEFTPTFKIWITGNYKPKVQDDSYGFWRRMRLIPFEITIPENKRKDIKEVLGSFDYSGILNWAVDGFGLWQFEGLQPPETVKKATEEYRGEQDVLQDFLDENCVYGDSHKVTKLEFRGRLLTYQKQSGYTQDFAPKRLTRLLAEKGIPLGGSGNAYYLGIGFLTSQEPY